MTRLRRLLSAIAARVSWTGRRQDQHARSTAGARSDPSIVAGAVEPDGDGDEAALDALLRSLRFESEQVVRQALAEHGDRETEDRWTTR